MLSITELTKGSLAVEFFRWILLVVDKIVDKVLAASVALAVNKCSPSGNRPAKLPLKRSLDSIPSRKPNAEKSGSQHLTGSLAQGIPRNKAGSARYLAGVDWWIPNDPVQAYLRAVATVRPLTNDEEIELSGHSCRVRTDTRMAVRDSAGSVL